MSLQGKFLIASPHLLESNFFRTVSLIIRHNDEEAFGLVLNRPTSQPLRNVIEMVSHVKCVHDDVVYQGGPVEGPLVALHTDPLLADLATEHGLFLSSSQDKVLRLVSKQGIRLRAIDGYAGWGPNQLEDEIQQGSWLILDATQDEILGRPERLWESLVYRYGRDLITSATGIQRVPHDPQCN